MEDIIIDDRRQLSAKAVSRELEANKGKPRRRRFRQYVVDLLVKSLIAACFIGIDFVLFAQAGSYSLFSGVQQLNVEAAYILGGIFALCFIIGYVLSFSKFLQNLFATAAFALFTLAVLHQFALFDKESLLANSFNMGKEVNAFLRTSSHWVLTGILSLIFFIFMSVAGRLTQSYLLGILLFIFGGLLAQGYMNPTPYNYRTVFDTISRQETADETDDGKRFIHIAMPELTSFSNLRSFKLENKLNKTANEKIQTAMDAMLGFYVQNNFILYQNAYVEGSNPFLNLTRSYNPGSAGKNPETDTLSNVLLKGYFDFDNIVSPTVYLKNNKLFDSFRKNKYHLKVYESRGIETCSVNNEPAVGKCVKKENIPFNLEQTNFSVTQKTYLLLIQWLESTGLISNFSLFNDTLRLFIKDLPSKSFSTKNLYVANSFKALDLAARDISTDRGNNAYFIILDMPSKLFIYDSFCRLKPLDQWISVEDSNTLKKREAYAEQLTCLYGQLENFMQKLANEYRLQKTVIVLESLNAPALNASRVKPTDYARQHRENKGVTMAIFDPLKNSFTLSSEICQASDILKSYLYKKAKCSVMSGMNLAEQPLKELLTTFNQEQITETEINRGLSNFLSWYQEWARTNNLSNNLDNLVPAPETAAPDESDSPSEIKEIPLAPSAEELGKEAAVQPLRDKIADDKAVAADQTNSPAEQPAAVSSVENLPAAETPSVQAEKAEPQVKMQVKVIDSQIEENAAPHDVIPPFIEDDDNEIPPAVE